jgi:hypothetical protein
MTSPRMSRVSLSLCLVAIAGIVDKHALGDGISSSFTWSRLDAKLVHLDVPGPGGGREAAKERMTEPQDRPWTASNA